MGRSFSTFSGFRFGRLVLACVALLPAAAFGQASMTGVVQDTSGGVLPGVTVEVASPALIEQVRVAVTDGAGRYAITNLRPGEYTVTFVLPGFATVLRDGIQLAGTAVATVNADMPVGTLEETITVTGEAPVVDVQSVTRQRVLDREILSILPSNRAPKMVAALTANVVISPDRMDVGGVTPFNLPDDLPVFVDQEVMRADYIVLGGGGRSSNIKISPEIFRSIPNIKIVPGLSLKNSG